MSDMLQTKTPLVSVWCLTYNHEKYIRDALNGFVLQQTDFRYEVVIHDDASTDNTIKIIREYEKNYPGLFKIIEERENIYHHPNRQQILREIKNRELTGKYVAFCEGDDYWIDPHKLQLQVDYLEKHPECMMVVHNAVEKNCRDGAEKAALTYSGNRNLAPEEIIMQAGGAIPTASMLLRREILFDLDFGVSCGIGDWPLQLNALRKGAVYYMDREMSVYRMYGNGSWSAGIAIDVQKRKRHFYNMLNLLKEYNSVTGGMFEDYIINKAAQFFWAYADLYINYTKNIDFAEALEIEKFEARIDIVFTFLGKDAFLSKQVQNFISQHEKCVIYGTGKLGLLVTQKLEKFGIMVDGYVVSDNQEKKDEFCGKPVWRLCEIPFDEEELGIIVAVNLHIWNEVREELLNVWRGDYIYSFIEYDDKKRIIEQLMFAMF